MRNRPKGMAKKQQKAHGFTLVELIAVVAIISMIAVFITIEINRSSDDAKIGIATAFLTSNVPAAISSYRARNLGSCRQITEPAAENEALPEAMADDAYATPTKRRLMARGLAAETPWDDYWSATYSDTDRTITIEFPLIGTNSGLISGDLERNLEGKSQIVSVGDGAAGGLSIVYSCS